MGFRIAEPTGSRAYQLLHHGGSSRGCKSMLMIAPELGIVVSVLTNYGSYDQRDSDAAAVIAAFAK